MILEKNRHFKAFCLTFFMLCIVLYTPKNLALGVDIPVPTNYSLIPPVNDSDYWGGRFDEGDLDHSGLDNLAWSVAGHTIDTNFDMNDNTIQNVGQLQTSATGVILNAYADDLILADHLRPFTTLDYDIGSGAYRWRWLYVQNVSSD